MKNIIGLILLFAGMILFFYPSFREWRTQSEVGQIISEFAEDAGRDGGGIPYPEFYEELQTYNRSLTCGQESRDVPEISLPDMERDVIGYIDIPDMKVRLPLYVGASQEHLARGAAVMAGTSMPLGGEHTNCVIAGHRGFRGSAFFQYIEDMTDGSRVYIVTPWERLTYQAVAFDIVNPEEAEGIRIRRGRDMVTLVSCHPYRIGGGAPRRYLVFCERVKEEGLQESKENKESKESGAEQADLIQWEERLRAWLPGITFVLSGVVILIRRRKT